MRLSKGGVGLQLCPPTSACVLFQLHPSAIRLLRTGLVTRSFQVAASEQVADGRLIFCISSDLPCSTPGQHCREIASGSSKPSTRSNCPHIRCVRAWGRDVVLMLTQISGPCCEWDRPFINLNRRHHLQRSIYRAHQHRHMSLPCSRVMTRSEEANLASSGTDKVKVPPQMQAFDALVSDPQKSPMEALQLWIAPRTFIMASADSAVCQVVGPKNKVKDCTTALEVKSRSCRYHNLRCDLAYKPEDSVSM